MARLTDHAKQRGKERLGLSVEATRHLATRALERGQPPAAFAGRLRRYLDGKAMHGCCQIRVYGEHVYVFGGDQDQALITVTALPATFRSVLRRLRAAAKDS